MNEFVTSAPVFASSPSEDDIPATTESYVAGVLQDLQVRLGVSDIELLRAVLVFSSTVAGFLAAPVWVPGDDFS